ncbi:MAG: acyl-CoA dehydrogenase [Spirochaetota bacterium]
MAHNPLLDSRDVRFVLFEMLNAEKLLQHPKFSDLDKEIFNETLELAERIAVDTFYPSNSAGDKEGGVKYDCATCEVKVPESVKACWKAFKEAGFFKLRIGMEEGGMGMPEVISTACDEYFVSGNTSAFMYLGLTHGAAALIREFGTDEQKKMFVDKMHNGEFSGTMCLTEPEAGSDVGNIKTKAVKQPDGTYLLTGQKIFISSGEHDITGNIIHAVLARIEGHPVGTKGLSLFIVPKYIVNPDGSRGERNDVICCGIEHKMGIKSSSTATLNFGENGKCVGYLLGEEQKGIKCMFFLMNHARISTGMQALGQSSMAYMHAVAYAKTRKQGVHISQMMKPDAHAVYIIEHPDVKRMLLWMKSYVEGMRMLAYFTSSCMDTAQMFDNRDARYAKGLIEILTPLIKAGISDMSWRITAEAIQVYGGYGYISEYPVEQFARDCKIFSIYEGTNGIQAMDLIFRKIIFNKRQYDYKVWRKKVKETISNSKGIVEAKYIKAVRSGLRKLDKALYYLNKQKNIKFMIFVLFNKILRRRVDLASLVSLPPAVNAVPFLQSMFMMVLAWLHLWSLSISLPKLKQLTGKAKGEELQKIINNNAEAAFYYGKVLSSQFFIGAEFPKFFGKIDCILKGETAVVEAVPAAFTGSPEV